MILLIMALVWTSWAFPGVEYECGFEGTPVLAGFSITRPAGTVKVQTHPFAISGLCLRSTNAVVQTEIRPFATFLPGLNIGTAPLTEIDRRWCEANSLVPCQQMNCAEMNYNCVGEGLTFGNFDGLVDLEVPLGVACNLLLRPGGFTVDSQFKEGQLIWATEFTNVTTSLGTAVYSSDPAELMFVPSSLLDFSVIISRMVSLTLRRGGFCLGGCWGFGPIGGGGGADPIEVSRALNALDEKIGKQIEADHKSFVLFSEVVSDSMVATQSAVTTLQHSMDLLSSQLNAVQDVVVSEFAAFGEMVDALRRKTAMERDVTRMMIGSLVVAVETISRQVSEEMGRRDNGTWETIVQSGDLSSVLTPQVVAMIDDGLASAGLIRIPMLRIFVLATNSTSIKVGFWAAEPGEGVCADSVGGGLGQFYVNGTLWTCGLDVCGEGDRQSSIKVKTAATYEHITVGSLQQVTFALTGDITATTVELLGWEYPVTNGKVFWANRTIIPPLERAEYNATEFTQRLDSISSNLTQWTLSHFSIGTADSSCGWSISCMLGISSPFDTIFNIILGIIFIVIAAYVLIYLCKNRPSCSRPKVELPAGAQSSRPIFVVNDTAQFPQRDFSAAHLPPEGRIMGSSYHLDRDWRSTTSAV